MENFSNFFAAQGSTYLNDLNAVLTARGLPALPCILVADDDGYNQNNVAFWVVKDGELSIGEHKIMSRGKRGRHLQTFANTGIGIYSSGDDEYTISPNLTHPEDTRTDDFAKTPLNRFLVHAALNAVGLTAGVQTALITGLPIAQQMKPGGVNEKLISAKTRNLREPVYVGAGKTPSAEILCHQVLPEAICGMVDWVMDNSGNFVRDPDVTRMALDIGGNTTDMVVILPGNEVAEVATEKYGVSHIRDLLRTMLEEKFEMTLDSIVLDEALQTRKAVIFGEEFDVSQEWETAVSSVLKNIFSAADALRQKYPSIREMVGFGGGVALCQAFIKERYPAIQTMENPDGANARGALKFATFGAAQELVDAINRELANKQEQ